MQNNDLAAESNESTVTFRNCMCVGAPLQFRFFRVRLPAGVAHGSL